MKDALGHGSDAKGVHSSGIVTLPRKPKPLSEMPRAALEKALEKARAASSVVIKELINEGFGHTKPSEILAMNTPLSQRYAATRQHERALVDEREVRMRYQGNAHPIKKSKWL